MKYKILTFLIIFSSCTTNYTKFENKKPYNATGFAYIYNELDFQKKIIKKKFENDKLQIAHNNLKTGSLIKLINPKTKESLVLKNSGKTVYPDFYKILITKKVANELNIDYELPIVELIELKKNKSFVAKKAKIFNEEKKISSNAPVTSVQISNISKNVKKTKKQKNNKIYITIATFYSEEVAEFLKKRISKEIPNYETKKLKLRKKSNKEIALISGPYKTINLVKNDYILLKKFGFEELDISTDD